MSKDITPRINRIHASIWRDVATRLNIATITKLLWLGLPKLQHGIDKLTIDFNVDHTMDVATDIAKLLPNIKDVYIYRSEYEEQGVCEQFARFIDVVRNREMTINYKSSGILQNYIKNTLLKMNCLSTITQFTLPHFIPTSMTLAPREKVPDRIVDLRISRDDFDDYQFTNVTTLALTGRISDYNVQSVNNLFARAPSSLTKLTYTTGTLSSPIILPESVVKLQLSWSGFNRPLLEITRNISILLLSVYSITDDVVKFLHPHITKLTINAYKIDNISLLNLIPSTTNVKIYLSVPCDFSSITDKYTVIYTSYQIIIKSRISY